MQAPNQQVMPYRGYSYSAHAAQSVGGRSVLLEHPAEKSSTASVGYKIYGILSCIGLLYTLYITLYSSVDQLLVAPKLTDTDSLPILHDHNFFVILEVLLTVAGILVAVVGYREAKREGHGDDGLTVTSVPGPDGGGGSGEPAQKRKQHDVVKMSVLLAAMVVAAAAWMIGSRSEVKGFLDQRWGNALDRSPYMIMEVQSKFHCCGFDKPRDRPWPKGNAEACVKTFGPTPCFPKLQQEFSNINTQLGSILLVIAFGQAAATYVVYRTLDRPKYASAFPQHVPSPYQPYYHHERTPLLVPYPSRDISDYPAHRVEFHPTRPATPNLMDIRSNAVEDWRWDAGTQLQADANGYSAAPPIVPPAVFQQPGVRGGEQQLPESVSGAGNLGVPRQGNEETA